MKFTILTIFQFLILLCLGIEPRALCMLGKCFAIEHLTIFKCTVQWCLKYVHIVVQTSPPLELFILHI
jgi:hypothetical protein